ncbi:MAG TPA: glycosyltransferase 87 family protein [Pyrinomonadaceae bacterium]|nr:glycosyltransferase 87 family protein [Pyrinomonadaceae bacterium]
MIGFSFTRRLTLSGAPFAGDFVEFYTAGKILNQYGSHRLYDFQLQDDLTREFLPAGLAIPFVTPPYAAILFSPLARLPLRLAYLTWILISIGLYLGAITLALRLEPLPRGITFLVCLAFPPFLMLVIAGGQISAIGCFIFALWLYLMRRQRKLIAGAVLGLLLYKPTLVVFLLPALLFGRQFRTLIGFTAVSGLLIMLSVWMIGPAGLIRYAAILREFSSLVGIGFTRPAMHTDLAAFVRQLFNVDIKYLGMALALPLTYLTRHNPERAMVPTMVFSPYVPVYDLILLVPLMIVAYRFVNAELLAVFFVISFFSVPICQLTGVQIITPVLLTLSYVFCVELRSLGWVRYETN